MLVELESSFETVFKPSLVQKASYKIKSDSRNSLYSYIFPPFLFLPYKPIYPSLLCLKFMAFFFTPKEVLKNFRDEIISLFKNTG